MLWRRNADEQQNVFELYNFNQPNNKISNGVSTRTLAATMRHLFAILFSIISSHLIGQINSTFNIQLSRKIDSIYLVDQKWRHMDLNYSENKIKDTTSYKSIQDNWRKSDSLNLIEAKNIFKQYGFPSYSLVGKESSNNFWIIVQHADNDVAFQEEYLRLMEKQTSTKNANISNYAFLVDRVKCNKKEKQIYGTQLWLNSDKTSFVIPDIIEPTKINDRRKSVGLNSIEEYIKEMNEFYKGKLQ